MTNLRIAPVFFLFIVSQVIYASDSGDLKCCCYSTAYFNEIRNAVHAPELIGIEDSEPFGKLTNGIPCLFPMGSASDKLGCIVSPFYGLLGSVYARYGNVKACGCSLPLCVASLGVGYGENCYVDGCLSPCICGGCSCGTVNECDCCVFGLGGGYASADRLGVIKWLFCLLPIVLSSETKNTTEPDVIEEKTDNKAN